MIVFDSDVLIDGLRNQPDAIRAISRCLLNGELTVSVLSVFELSAGVRTARELADVANLFSTVRTIAVTVELAQRAGEISSWLRRAGAPIGSIDVLIAATALDLDAPICTRNIREFARVPGLQLIALEQI